MKYFSFVLSIFALILPINSNASYNQQTEKALKKKYKEVTYLAYCDSYMVMSKTDKGYYGVCNSVGEVLIPDNYKKICFELTDDGDVIIFALDPNYKAESQGNIIYTKKKGKILDLGRSEPQYIVGGFLTSYGKPIYNMAGNVVLDCEQTAVQPLRMGNQIYGYGVSTRRMINKEAKEGLIICGPSFNKLFSLDGPGYLWKVNIDMLNDKEYRWKCSKSIGGNDFLTLLYYSDGTPIDQSNDSQMEVTDTHLMTAENKLGEKEHIQESNEKTTVVKRHISDIDVNPPITNRVAEKTFAVIISNENYSEVEKVHFALNDGEAVSNYFEKTLGIPKTNIKYVPDATLNNMRKQINWLKQIADAFGQEAKIIFYYSGHGVPDEQSKNAYLMPVDGYHSDMTTNMSVNHLYEELAALNVAQVTVFIDACFSGSQRGDNMLVSARGVKMKSRSDAPKGKLIVFSAAKGDETAYPYEEEGHGMFTYYLLKKLKMAGDKVTLGELSEYISTEVKRCSLLHTDKLQSPSISVSPEIENGWEDRSL